MKYLPALLALWLASPCAMCAQRVKTMVAEFAETTQDTKTSVVEGTVFYEFPATVTLKVEKPLNQWIRITAKSTLVYYPDRALAFNFRNTNPIPVSLAQPLSMGVTSDLGLSKAGFVISHKEIKDGTLYVHWKPPEQAGKNLGTVVVGMARDELVSVAVLDGKGREAIKTTYANYVRHKSLNFPLEMVTVTTLKGASTSKTTVLKEPRFDVELPKEVADFKLPPGVKVEEMGQ